MSVKIIPSMGKARTDPDWTLWFRATWALFTRLNTKQKVHAASALCVGFLCFGLISMVTIDQIAANYTPPLKTMGITTPMNLTVDIPEDTPTFVGEESEFIEPEPEVKPAPVAKKRKERNEQAPRFVSSIVPQDANEYIRMYARAAQASERKYRVPASITLAQGLVEGNAGKSSLAREANNHFGIKCFDRNCKKGHCINKTDDTHKDFFRKYRSVQECFDDHGQKISSGRYAKLKQYGKDYRAWARGLKKCGYATDRNYANTLISTIEKYKLYRYD
jgi:hypothetical protein